MTSSPLTGGPQQLDSEEFAVELWAASIPNLGRIVDHHWLVVRTPARVDRWEVWQSVAAGGENWGHLHRNLMHPEAGIGKAPARKLMRWLGADACTLAERIAASPQEYPWRDRYLPWPGPNSNTFVQWVLQNQYALCWRGIGRRYYYRGLKAANTRGGSAAP
jgi:hypothetical protein